MSKSLYAYEGEFRSIRDSLLRRAAEGNLSDHEVESLASLAVHVGRAASMVPICPATSIELPSLAEPASDRRPPSVPTAVVKMEPGYRPRARPKNPTRETSQPRPTSAEKKMCDACGGDAAPDQDFRTKCPKCNAKAWVSVPAHRDLAASAE